MGRSNYFRKINTTDEALNKVQANVESAITPVLQCKLLDGHILSDLELVSGSNRIEHKLGRTLIGYFPVRQSNASTIYDTSIDDKFLYLTASANITVSLWVF